MDKTLYPNLRELLEIIGNDNGLRLRDEFRWPYQHGYDLNYLEMVAERMGGPLRHVYATEDSVIQDAITKVYSCQSLHDFLNDAFDGRFTDIFYM